MPERDYIFTSESVSEGHPDKVCDLISDSIVDAFIARAPEARLAVEVLTTTNNIVLAGEVRPDDLMSDAELEEAARQVVKEIGYEQDGFHWQTAKVENKLHAQSAHIAQGVDASDKKAEGAGDQGAMFGYACRETDALMPAPIFYAHKILFDLAQARKSGAVDGLQPDAKSQVSLRYENGQPIGAASIVVSTQHDAGLSQEDVRDIVRPFVARVLPDGWMPQEKDFYVNPTGQFVIGGPDGDAGLTGRKIIVDTYGGAAPHGGGAFSGKDPTKVDRSAAYAARYLAKNIVAAELAERCTIQLAYAIGVSEPLAVVVNTHGTGQVSDARLEVAARKVMDLTPYGIRTHLALNKPIYKRTAAYGHFGRAPEKDGGFSWERTDLIEAMQQAV